MDQNTNPPQTGDAGAPYYGQRAQVAPVLSLGQWVVTLLLLMIPLINIILLIVWAASTSENPNRRHFARAQLIMMVPAILLYVLIMVTFGAAIMSGLGK